MGLETLDGALTPTTEALLKRKNKRRLIIDLDSTKGSAHGKQEGVAYIGLFAKNCFHPLFAFTSDGDCLGAKLSPGDVHSAMAPGSSLSPWWSVNGSGSSFFDSGATPRLPNQKFI